jgi:hypothetical protein
MGYNIRIYVSSARHFEEQQTQMHQVTKHHQPCPTNHGTSKRAWWNFSLEPPAPAV